MAEKELMVVLPYPNRNLFPNARPHWARKARIVKGHRELAWLATIEQCGRRAAPIGKIKYKIIYTPKTNRARDEDNIIAACKSYFDGIADALGVNDKIFTIRGVEAMPASRLHSQIVIKLNWTEKNEDEQPNG